MVIIKSMHHAAFDETGVAGMQLHCLITNQLLTFFQYVQRFIHLNMKVRSRYSGAGLNYEFKLDQGAISIFAVEQEIDLERTYADLFFVSREHLEIDFGLIITKKRSESDTCKSA